VGFGRDFLPALLQLGGDHGARHLVDGARDRVRSIPIDDPGILRDVDVPADLRNGAPRWGA
jgi:molybdenum cofactor cytidylyltransferase